MVSDKPSQIRISPSLNGNLKRLSDVSGFTKEQLVDMFVGDCIEAVEREAPPSAPLQCVAFLRHKLEKPEAAPPLDRLVSALEKFNAAQEGTGAKKKQAARKRAA